MNDLVKLTEEIVKSLVVDADGVSVKEFPSEDEKTMLIQVMVNEDDIGRVIGKDGKTANAIRTLVQASSALNGNKYVKINIDKF
ncbi:MAG: KH domain-containing protein [Bacilli bacterium]|nr:KH domain-containing protein [Bacilli bacterium]